VYKKRDSVEFKKSEVNKHLKYILI